MNAIIAHSKEAIAKKKKQIEANQFRVNNMVFELNDHVRNIYELKKEIELLEADIYSYEKSRPGSVSTSGSNDCTIDGLKSLNPVPNK